MPTCQVWTSCHSDCKLIFKIKIKKKTKLAEKEGILLSKSPLISSYLEIFNGLNHWSPNSEFCSTTFYSNFSKAFSITEKPHSTAFSVNQRTEESACSLSRASTLCS